MLSINITLDARRVEQSLLRLSTDLQNKAISRAVNKTAAAAKTEATREVRKQGYNIKASAISKSMSIHRASNTTLEAVVMVSGSPIPLINYGAKQVRTGVSVQVKTGRKIIRGAFIAQMKSGHRGVFVRVGNRHVKVIRNGRTIWTGLPIKQLYGPSIPVAVSNEAVQKAMQRAIKTKYPKLLAHEIRFLLADNN